MSDLQRSILFLAGIAAGLVGGLSGSAEQETVTKSRPIAAPMVSAPVSKDEDSTAWAAQGLPSGFSAAEASPAASPALSARLADWWQRALALRPGEAPALFREIENEMGTKLSTFYVLAAGSDPEGALAVYRDRLARGIQTNGNALFRAWALRDAAAAERAAMTMPEEDQERLIEIIRYITKPAEPPPAKAPPVLH